MDDDGDFLAQERGDRRFVHQRSDGEQQSQGDRKKHGRSSIETWGDHRASLST